MKKLFGKSIILSLVASAALWASAFDLPVKRVNGRDYYYYEVQRGETVLQIAEKLGVSREAILRYNPAASDGLRAGTKLYLPVDKFKGDDSTGHDNIGSAKVLRYKVRKGETLYGIAYRFGVAPASIIALNPSADYGVKNGQIIMIPAEGMSDELIAEAAAGDDAPVAAVAPRAQDTPRSAAENRPGKPVAAYPHAAPVADETAPEAGIDIEGTPDNRRLRPVEPPTGYLPAQVDTPVVALLAPLDLDGNMSEKHSRNALDFVRGFLMGLEAGADAAYPVDMRVLDTRGSEAVVDSLLASPSLSGAGLVIAPDEAAGLRATLRDVRGRDCFVLNLFAAQDTSYLSNPQSVQTYIPTALMYEKACEALLDEYGDHTPVFLIAKNGKSEKLPFTNYLRDVFAAGDIATADLVFEGILSADDLSGFDREGKYVFIPASGSHGEFTRFARALINFKGEFANPDDVALFGYPDWTAFIDESLDNLHTLGAKVYTRFYNDSESQANREFVEEFEQTYGAKPLERLPSQAILGYDSARYILSNLRNNANSFNPEDGTPYTGLQSTFMFVTSDEEDTSDDVRTTGPVNQALYIVTYRPGGSVSVEVM